MKAYIKFLFEILPLAVFFTVNSVENIWDGFGHNQFDFKKNWFPIIYNFSYTWHLEFLGKKIN